MDKNKCNNPDLDFLNQTFNERFGEKEFEEAKRKARFKLELAQTLSSRRKSIGLGQKCLAKKLKTSQQQLSRYEIGKNAPTIDRLYDICESLDMNIIICDKKDGHVILKT